MHFRFHRPRSRIVRINSTLVCGRGEPRYVFQHDTYKSTIISKTASRAVTTSRPLLFTSNDASELQRNQSVHERGHTTSRYGVQSHGIDVLAYTGQLPTTCPGCGALSHEENLGEAGFYTRSRKAVKRYLEDERVPMTDVLRWQHETLGSAEATATGAGSSTSPTAKDNQSRPATAVPVCDRCHDLLFYSKGRPITHPTLEALADSIAQSPFKRNHVYHVLDAADFPMSLFPNVFKTLNLTKPRGQNRRAKHKFSSKPTVSFVITRSDLLGPTKEMVDKMLPYCQDVLRNALGKLGDGIRLGNVHLVSAKRGWWTKDIKDSIWARGGGNWMVGRVNVGKSNLFEVLFPKGSGERAPVYASLRESQGSASIGEEYHDAVSQHEFLAEESLLPPPQREHPFPSMPVVSSLPGTTASPIRLPFGNHRGELIDLPGLERGNLEDYVSAAHKRSLVMQYRPNVQQHVIRPGQSLILGGGLVRITPELDPKDPSTTMLAYPFVPLAAHVTATEKAVGIQLQGRESGIESILAPDVGHKITRTGWFKLNTDVTKSRAGALTRAGVPIAKLPFRVYSTDILIEGVGWIELVCQVRRQRVPETGLSTTQPLPSMDFTTDTSQDPDELTNDQVHESQSVNGQGFKPFSLQTVTHVDAQLETANASQAHFGQHFEFVFPRVEVFSPDSRYIAQRKSLGAWLTWQAHRAQITHGTKSVRPRRSMKGVKKAQKLMLRAKASAITEAGNVA